MARVASGSAVRRLLINSGEPEADEHAGISGLGGFVLVHTQWALLCRTRGRTGNGWPLRPVKAAFPLLVGPLWCAV